MIQTKETPVEHEIVDLIKDRWSPRSFSDQSISEETLNRLFEAMRWAPSSMNEQPWRVIFAHKGEDAHQKMANTLMEGNRSWANEAPVLLVTLVKTHFTRNDAFNRAAPHDLGLAIGNLSIQATAEGIGLHQMGGIDLQAVKEEFEIPKGFEPFSGIALGYFGNPDDLPEDLRQRELSPRRRKDIEQFAFHGTFRKE